MFNQPQSLRFLWQYMVYADGEILAASQTVADEGYRAPHPISFGSLHDQLVHVVVVQETWLARLQGERRVYPATPPAYSREELACRWPVVHDQLLTFAAAQTESSVLQTLSARNRAGKQFKLPCWICMAHVADHATYHRGQINTMIRLGGGKPSAVSIYHYGLTQGFGEEIVASQPPPPG